jgi:hypothetical protein
MAIKTDYITYKQIIVLMNDFADDHYEINYFGTGDIWEVVEDEDFDYLNYPMMWVVPTAVNIEEGSIEYDFQIIMASIQFDKDGETLYEDHIISDSITRYIDLLSYLKVDPMFKTNRVRIFKGDTSTGTPFTERFSDNLVGVTFDLTVRQSLNLNSCAIPKA